MSHKLNRKPQPKNIHNTYKANGFEWPTHILHEGRLIKRAYVEPNFICFTLPVSQMNKKVYVSKEQIHAFNNGIVSKRQKKRAQEARERNNKKYNQIGSTNYKIPFEPTRVNTVNRSIMYKSDESVKQNTENISQQTINNSNKQNKKKLLNINYYKQQKLL